MQPDINDKTYPVKKVWILKASIESSWVYFVIGLFVLAFFAAIDVFNKEFLITYLGIFICSVLFLPVFSISLIICALKKRNFRYEFEENVITISQGVLSKQKVSMFYSTLQNVFIRQGFWDRIFKTYSLAVQNVEQKRPDEDIVIDEFREQLGKGLYIELIGVKRNTLNIPGLKRTEAETLKRIILEKMKENVDKSRSGL